MRNNSTGRFPVIEVVLMFGFLAFMAAVPVFADIVTFPDPGLESAIREAIGKPTGDIYDTDLAGLTSLDASRRRILNLDGLQYCVNLTSLNLIYNSISDVDPLSGLINLTNLDLSRNRIDDIGPLSELTDLTKLDLRSNRISDTGPLSGLTNLTRLYLGENQISDIQALVDNPGLGKGYTLEISNNYLDLTPNSPDMLNIEALRDRGVDVKFEPQS